MVGSLLSHTDMMPEVVFYFIIKQVKIYIGNHDDDNDISSIRNIKLHF